MCGILAQLLLRGGEITLDGTNIGRMSSRESASAKMWVPQAHDGAFAFSVIDMVLMARSPHLNTFTQPAPRDREIEHSWSTTHRDFLPSGKNWFAAIKRATGQRNEKKVAVEADNVGEVLAALEAAPDILHLDKFTPKHARYIAQQAPSLAPSGELMIGGSITLSPLPHYLDCGIEQFITSAPWYASQVDIQVTL